ncbi:MAG: hypothetical protein AAGK78_10665, partial [Planctomycetota bacterium]
MRITTVLCVLLPSQIYAQDQSPIDAPRVIVEVKGKRADGRRAFSSRLRRTIADRIGGLRSSRKFRRAQRKLGIPKRKQTYPSRLARAAREIKAEFVVFARVSQSQDKEGYAAKGYLVSAATGKILTRLDVAFATLKGAGGAGVKMANMMLDALEKHRAPPQAPLADATDVDVPVAAPTNPSPSDETETPPAAVPIASDASATAPQTPYVALPNADAASRPDDQSAAGTTTDERAAPAEATNTPKPANETDSAAPPPSSTDTRSPLPPLPAQLVAPTREAAPPPKPQ